MSVTLHAITFDCADPDRLAAFWAAFLGREPDASQMPGFDHRLRRREAVLRFPEARRPVGGAEPRACRLRNGGNLDGETERLVGLGATVVQRVEENGIRFVTFADPEGNKFDVTDE